MRTLTFFLLGGLAATIPAPAHQQPTTLVLLNTHADGVDMSLHVPLSELELAFGHGVNQQPPRPLAEWSEDFRRYLRSHIQPQTDGGLPWTVEVRQLQLGESEQSPSGPFQEVFVKLSLTPPPGASARRFTLRYDAILHQVVTHKTMVSVQSDWGAGRYGAARLVKIVSAFTLGHSATLLAGALQWLVLPQQPVEILIAVSILITAAHALRPLFPGREALVAAGFGLVHGLAFASVLAELQLPPGAMMLSILGFNLGIELMQVLVLAMTLPWLALISFTPAHQWFRIAGAALADVAAGGWILNRITGESNAVERLMTEAGGRPASGERERSGGQGSRL